MGNHIHTRRFQTKGVLSARPVVRTIVLVVLGVGVAEVHPQRARLLQYAAALVEDPHHVLHEHLARRLTPQLS